MCSRGTCSVCFEDYKGRTPKLLPCFHTFCVICLGHLVHKENKLPPMRLPLVPDNAGDKKTVSLTCPTCRTVIPVPSGGVAQFQTNFYLEDVHEVEKHPTPCSLCDGDQLRDAKFRCSKCEKCFCQDCRRYHDKLCEGVKVKALQVSSGARPKETKNSPSNQTKQQIQAQLQTIEKILMELREEEEAVNVKKTSMEEDINVRYATVMRHASDAQAMSLESVRKACAGTTQQLQSYIKQARQAQDTLLQQLSSANASSAPSHPPPVDVEDLQAKVRERTKFTLRLSARFDPAMLVSCLLSFLGEVEEISKNPFSWTKDSKTNTKGNSQSLKEAASPAQAGAVPNADSADVPASVKQQLKDLTEKLSKLQVETDKKIATVKSSLQQEIGGLQDRYATLQQNNAALTRENAKLRRQGAGVGPEQGEGNSDRMQRDLQAAQSQITSLQTSVGSLEDLVRSVSANTAELEITMAEMSSRVAFHAELDRAVTTRTMRILFMREVRTNVGGAYNASTGVFTAPVSGIYCFFATIGPGLPDKIAEVDITVDGVRTVSAHARHESVSSCHAILDLTEGQNVFLKTTPGENRYAGDGVTSFCGMLLQIAPNAFAPNDGDASSVSSEC